MHPLLKSGWALAAILASQLLQAAPNSFRDPIDTPARESVNAARSMMMDSARTPDGTLIAVGRRGVIVTSRDGGASWNQASVPVSTDLVSVTFATDQLGWAVGHAGVVIHTRDGGLTWERQLDGRALPDLMIRQYKEAAASGDESAERNLQEAERFKADGPGRPLLAVLFTDAEKGIAVGAYNLAIRTDDGGKTWHPISDRLDNPKGMHLYSLAMIDGALWVAGEQGVLLKEDAKSKRFVKVPAPYAGSLFGVVGKAGEMYVFGLRGNALRSRDGGATWTVLKTGTQSNLTAGDLLPDGTLVLVDASGELLESRDGGETFLRPVLKRTVPLFGVASAGNGQLLLTGAVGVTMQGVGPASAISPQHESTEAR